MYPPLLVFLLGILTHISYFRKGEHHRHAPQIFFFYAIVPSLLSLLDSFLSPPRRLVPILFSLFFHILGLLGSIVIYRLFFHRLNSFDGPYLLRITKLWHVWKVRNRKNYLYLEELRREYGSFVRTGPNEITIFDPSIFTLTSGPGTSCIKSDWYDVLHPLVAINSIRKKEGYAARRKIWDDAFKSSALKKDTPTVLKYANQLLQRLKESADSDHPVKLSDLFARYAYTIMSELAFGKQVQDLRDEVVGRNISLTHKGMAVLGVISPAPWLAQLLLRFPVISQSWNRLIQWTGDYLDESLKANKSEDNAASWLIDAARNDDGCFKDRKALYGDAFSVCVAGSHSVGATLTCLFYQLARNPRVQQKLREEIKSACIPSEYEEFQKATYLDACIDETLRLHPVLLTAGARQTTARGLTVAGRYIPPYTNIIAPRYSIGRLESCFAKPTEFIPERWTENSEMVKDRRAYNGFSIGRHTCPGKRLGLIETRIATAMLLKEYKVCLAPGEGNETRVENDMTDNFTMAPGDLEVVFVKV
ncbi:cytochrome P450 [Delitschia confertaspora ATCC 74209]|uniref:Cytochrome P450 n=1 Tax=Delitschia confertaspora ATCC 74209 TaxID=1513339 RepID=A0A9P4JPV8_9PLEO|nr:cytochrome P450 [Delitschia confertaspora ATCC 74209]